MPTGFRWNRRRVRERGRNPLPGHDQDRAEVAAAEWQTNTPPGNFGPSPVTTTSIPSVSLAPGTANDPTYSCHPSRR